MGAVIRLKSRNKTVARKLLRKDLIHKGES